MRCRRQHQRLRGAHLTKITKRIPWTLVAQPYPLGTQQTFGDSVLPACEVVSHRTAHCGSLRPHWHFASGWGQKPWTPKQGSSPSACWPFRSAASFNLALEAKQLRASVTGVANGFKMLTCSFSLRQPRNFWSRLRPPMLHGVSNMAVLLAIFTTSFLCARSGCQLHAPLCCQLGKQMGAPGAGAA